MSDEHVGDLPEEPMTLRQDEQTEAVPEAPQGAPHPHLALIDQWFRDSFVGSPLGQNTHHFGIVHAAVVDLKRRITSAKGV
jgi:hypothetical protein